MQVDTISIQPLALKCLVFVQDLYPTQWKTILIKRYIPIVEAEMISSQADCWQAAIKFYNDTHNKTEKIWWLAAAKNIDMGLQATNL